MPDAYGEFNAGYSAAKGDFLQEIRELNAKVERLQAERDELREVVERVYALVSAMQSDMWQTARANQTNLDGRDPLFPADAPAQECAGRHRIHQSGIDESLRLVKQSKAWLREAAEKARADDGS